MAYSRFPMQTCAKCGHVHTSPLVCNICGELVPAYAALKASDAAKRKERAWSPS